MIPSVDVKPVRRVVESEAFFGVVLSRPQGLCKATHDLVMC